MNPSLHLETLGAVTRITLQGAPYNYLDAGIIASLADALEQQDTRPVCRAIVLASAGKAFCAGARFGPEATEAPDPAPLYAQAMRLFHTRLPIVAAIQGPAIGAGLGLALVADFRVAANAARFSANFTRLGFHPGFGLSETLPRLVGQQHAARLFYTGARIDATQALAIGLIDAQVADNALADHAMALATEIAGSAPAAVASTRATLRQGMVERIVAANQRECALQREQFRSADFREGVAAMAERRTPNFTGR